MKKSTLITTIAMIVVVVVALSTATYAWFSSSQTAVASTNFTTNASGDWSLMVGSITGSELTFNGTAVESTTLATTEIQKGLWAPTATIATTIASNAASTTIASPAGFVQAQKSGETYAISRLQTGAYDSSASEGTGAPGVGYIAPFALRIMNVSGKTQTLQLNITLNAKQTGTTNSMYAAAAVRFYVYEISNAESGATASYTSGYYPIASTESDSVNAKTAINGNVTQGSVVTMTPGLAGTVKTGVAPDETLSSTAVTIANYNVANIAGQFTKAGSANENLGIAQNDYVRTYTFDMQQYAASGFSNIIIYAWIDGWVANGSAASANFDVNFGFTSAPTLSA